MPQNSEQGETGRVYRVEEVRITVSRRDFRSLLLVRRRLQTLHEEARFVTPTEIGGLFDVINSALPRSTPEVWNVLNGQRGPVTYGPEEDDLSDEDQ